MKRIRKNAPINTFANANESRVNLRLTQAEAELCKARARELGVSINTYVRNAVLKACAEL